MALRVDETPQFLPFSDLTGKVLTTISELAPGIGIVLLIFGIYELLYHTT